MEEKAHETTSKHLQGRSEHAHFKALLNGGTVDGIHEKTIFKPGALKYAGATITWIHPLEYVRNLLTLPLWLGSLIAFLFYACIVTLFALLYFAGGDECTSASTSPAAGGDGDGGGITARRSSAEHLIATKALRCHSYGLDAHCRSVLRDPMTGRRFF